MTKILEHDGDAHSGYKHNHPIVRGEKHLEDCLACRYNERKRLRVNKLPVPAEWTCCAIVDRGDLAKSRKKDPHPCTALASHQVDGRFYCQQHNPEKIAANSKAYRLRRDMRRRPLETALFELMKAAGPLVARLNTREQLFGTDAHPTTEMMVGYGELQALRDAVNIAKGIDK